MKLLKKYIPYVIILLPLLIAGILRPFPFPEKIRQANQVILSSVPEQDNLFDSLELLIDFQPWRSDLWERLGRESLNAGEYEPAIAAFQKGDETGGLSIEGNIAWADALILNGNHDLAKQILRENFNARCRAI